MSTRRPIVLVAGKPQEIAAPDTIDPAVLPASTGAGRTFAFFAA